MYILTSKYFPTDSWPDLYFPALPEGADIQYKEVVEFSLAAISSAPFTLAATLTAPFTVEMPMLVEMQVYEELSL